MRAQLIITCLIGILLLSSCLHSCDSVAAPVNSDHITSSVNVVPEWLQELQPHNIIEIFSDNDFVDQGWAGSGTESDPIIIEGIMIRAEYTCVLIWNTTKYFEIRRCLFTHKEHSMGGGSAIIFRNVTNGHVTGCYINETIYGILSFNSTNCQFTNNIVFGNEWGAISFEEYGQDILVANNTIHDTTYGLLLNYESNNLTIRDNHIYDCYTGAYLVDAQCCNILRNRIWRNNFGMVLRRGCSIITNNSIYGNDAIGIYIISGNASNDIYGNFIGWNANHNAQDDSNSTRWDDGLGNGNIWSDYNSSGQYPIYGTSASYDRWPLLLEDTKIPTIDSPPDLDYEFGCTNKAIRWNTDDDFPFDYQLLWNGQLINEGTWIEGIFAVAVDTLPPGTYSLLLRLWDAQGNLAADSVSIHVAEAIPPIVDHPSDIEYVAGDIGHNITWAPEDDYPSAYEIFINGTLFSSGYWNGSEIIVNVDGFDIGLYNVTLIVFDAPGQKANDSVFVKVIAPPTNTTSSGFMFALFLAGVGIIGFVVTFSILYAATPYLQRIRTKTVLDDKDEISEAMDEIKAEAGKNESQSEDVPDSDDT